MPSRVESPPYGLDAALPAFTRAAWLAETLFGDAYAGTLNQPLTVAAPGPLAVGLYARVVFGQLVADGDVPKGMPAQFSWITDNAYKLEGAKPG